MPSPERVDDFESYVVPGAGVSLSGVPESNQ